MLNNNNKNLKSIVLFKIAAFQKPSTFSQMSIYTFVYVFPFRIVNGCTWVSMGQHKRTGRTSSSLKYVERRNDYALSPFCGNKRLTTLNGRHFEMRYWMQLIFVMCYLKWCSCQATTTSLNRFEIYIKTLKTQNGECLRKWASYRNRLYLVFYLFFPKEQPLEA